MLVTKHFASIEDLITDEDFLAWYTGESTQKAKAWEQWLAGNPQYKSLVEESIQYLDAIKLNEVPVSTEQVDIAHNRLLQSINEDTKIVSMKPRRTKWWLSAAAAILILITGAIFWKNTNEAKLKINTAFGQVASHELPDGSEVMLNANSKLSMKKSWEGSEDREVWLEGEAFFHVKKTSAKNRFIVHANSIDIIVTGTQFNVVNRQGESNVLLKEGSVTVKTAEGKMIKMVPGDFITFRNSLPQKEAEPEEKVLAWTQAKLFFEHTPLVDAAKTISQHYGVKVKVDRDIQDESIDGILSNDNLDILLKAIEEAKGVKITRTNDGIFISRPQL